MARTKNQYEYDTFVSNCSYDEFCVYQADLNFVPGKTYAEMHQFLLSKQLKKESQKPDLLILDDGDTIMEVYP